MSKPYIERKYVELSEDVEQIGLDAFSTWNAHIYGPSSTGENVTLSRYSASAGEALLLLTEALAEQGYELR